MLERKLKLYYLSSKEERVELMGLIGTELIMELLNLEVVYVVMNHVSNGLMVCDAQRKSDLGRGYLPVEDYEDYTTNQLWSMVVMRALAALEQKASFNDIPKGHKFEMLEFYSIYLYGDRTL